MRSWILVVVFAGVSLTGRAQTSAASGGIGTGTELPSAPKRSDEADGPRIDLQSVVQDGRQVQQQSMLMVPPKTMWGDDPALLHGALAGTAADDEARRGNSFVPSGSGAMGRGGLGAFGDNDPSREGAAGTPYKSSSYVPLDSWIYPALDRLAAMGYVETGSASVRPLTRLECARLLAEAHDDTDDGDLLPGPILAALDKELAHETSLIDGGKNAAATMDSAYARITGVAGTPLRDGFHFGQTLVDDYGRPYGQGANLITGLSGHSEAGPFSIYVRGEYQYASAITPYSTAIQETIANFDRETEGWQTANGAPVPLNWNMTVGTTNRPRLIEAYASVNVANWQLSFGQQSLWWGPDRTTSLMLSNNAAAMPMLRLSRAKPLALPSLLRWLGPVHFDSFFARQGGIHYVALGPTFVLDGSPNQAVTPPPYLWGAIATIEPTKNLEFGFSHTTIFAGLGRPLTFGTFFHSFSLTGNAQTVDPGKRATGFNIYYHVPELRKYLVVYIEGLAWDDPFQGSFLQRYAMAPGIYLPRLPGLKKLDLRAEGVYTNLPGLKDPAYFYANAHYPQGYTNYGQLLGSWVGREGRGAQVSGTYWFSARTKATASYRRASSDKSLLQGGDLNDVSGSFTWLFRPGIELSANAQYERWNFSLLAPSPQSNFTSAFQIRIFPKVRTESQ
jgi:hypothetical protein